MKILLASVLVLGSSLSVPHAVAQEAVIRAVTALPSNNEMTRRFMAFVEAVNDSGAGVVRIDVVGGPEAIPSNQQDTALRNGVVDMQTGPSAYYSGTVPEAFALQGATVSAAVARDNGAFDRLSEAWTDRLGAELISWLSSGIQYYVFLSEPPSFHENGDLNLTGVELRSVPTYRDWFNAMGAQNVMMEQSDIYTALERGVVDGFGWIVVAEDLGVYDLLEARVGPGVWQANTVIMMNGESWDRLSEEAQQIIRDAALAIEQENMDHFAQVIAAENAALEAAGVEIVDLQGEAAARHIQRANDLVWGALERVDAESAAVLRPLLDPR